MNKLIDNIKNKIKNSNDFILKNINIKNKTIYLLFNEVLIDSVNIDEFILKKLNTLNTKELDNLNNILPVTNIKIINDKDIFNYVNNGFLIIIYKNIYVIEFKSNLYRSISNVENELSIKGPKDSFIENFNTNLGLIRRRIKTEKLKCIDLYYGRLTNTKVGILYIDGITDKKLINEVKLKLSTIDIDGIIDSTYLKENLESKNLSFFPTIMTTERPDKASMALLDGKICIIVDTSPYIIILPNFFIDFFHTVDDYYQKPINISFIRFIRLIAFFIAIFVPGIYIMLTTHNYDFMTLDMLISLKAQRMSVPFSEITESLIMMMSFEILRESDIRMSSTSGSAVSILGGLILGDAAVSAGIISPIMIIIIAISSISALVFNSIELVSAIRWWRLIILILAALFGIEGIVLGIILLFLRLVTIKCFNKPYLAPFIPINIKELKDTYIKFQNKGEKYRNNLLTKNIKRGHFR